MDDVEHSGIRGRAAESLRLTWDAVRLVWRLGPWLLIGLLALLLGQAVLAPVQLLLTQRAVNAVVDLIGGVGDPLPWLVALAATVMITVLVGPVVTLLQNLLGDRITDHVGAAVIEAVNGWPGVARFEDPTFADDLRVARYRAAGAGLQIVSYLARAVLAAFTVVAVAITLGGLHLWLPVVILLAQLPSTALTFRFNDVTGSMLYSQTPQARRMDYLRAVALGTDVAKDIRLAGAFGFLSRRHRRIFHETLDVVRPVRRRLVTQMTMAELLAMVVFAGCYVLLVHEVLVDRIDLGGFVLFAGAILLLRSALGEVGFSLGFLPKVLRFLPSLDRILTAGPDLPAGPAAASVRAPGAATGRHGVELHEVTFRYPGTDGDILRGVSATIGPGESVALVGPNGSGKTTLVKLLLRLYDPTEGWISLDGVDLRDYEVSELRQRMSVVFQDFGRYQLTVRENIAFGRTDEPDADREIDRAAEESGAAGMIRALPQGLDTALGLELGDRELSGGQWQRIALARAFVGTGDLLVLDEPTADLDPRAEYEVFERFRQLTRGRMTVLVSHRFSTVRLADRILVLGAGRVREQGSHHQLMATDGEYARLYRIQAGQYLDDLDDVHDLGNADDSTGSGGGAG